MQGLSSRAVFQNLNFGLISIFSRFITAESYHIQAEI